MQEKANSQLIKKMNEVRLLNLIRNEGPISRREIARRTKISKVAVSEIINRLDKAGFILEIGKGNSTKKGGKRPTLLKLNPNNKFVIGIEVKRKFAKIGLANIDAEIKGIESISYEPGESIDNLMPYIFEKIDFLLEKFDVSRKKLVSIALGIPGFVDYEKGELIFADTLKGWANIPLASRIEERYRVPIIVENDVNVITFGECLLGAGRRESNLVCIWTGEGIGSGIIMGDQLIRGETGISGEIGYLEISHHLTKISNLKDIYTDQLYFGEVLSEANLLEALKRKLSESPGKLQTDNEKRTLENLLAAGDQGNELVRKVLDEYAFLMAIVCMNYIKTINPSLIILNGRVIENSEYLFKKIRQLVKEGMKNIPFEASTIVIGELKEDAGVKGAIVFALHTIFESPLSKNKHYVKVR